MIRRHSIAHDRPARRRTNHAERGGFSMLEMLLSLAILGGSLAVLSRIGADGTNAAIEAKELASCRILAQRKMSELLLDTTVAPISMPASPIDPFDSLSTTAYEASVEVQPGQMDGLLIVRVTVTAPNPDTVIPYATYVLDRWMIDPAMGLAEMEAEEQAMIDDAAAVSESSGAAPPGGA